jgi:hypothetical protein
MNLAKNENTWPRAIKGEVDAKSLIRMNKELYQFYEVLSLPASRSLSIVAANLAACFLPT